MKNFKCLLIFRSTCLILLLSFFYVSCKNNAAGQYSYQKPQQTKGGLTVGSLDEVNIDKASIATAIDKIKAGRFKEIHSMLIYRNGKLVLEEYFQGNIYQWDAPDYDGEFVQWNKDMHHLTMSGTKSFMSACIGIAIDRGFIKSVNQSIFDYLPDYQHLKTNNREYITIEHLLTMTSGLIWDEWSAPHANAANDIDMLYLNCEDPIVCVLNRSWRAEPGKVFTYNGGGMVILAEILRNATNMNVDEFSMKYLFEPLAIDSTRWWQYGNGMYDAAGSLAITPRSMLRFGVLYLNNGEWNGVKILSSDWIEKSSTPFNQNKKIKVPGEDSRRNGYAYSWWINSFTHSGKEINVFRANGWGGQSIMVFPELDMVVVLTGGNYTKKSKLFSLIEKHLLPAVE